MSLFSFSFEKVGGSWVYVCVSWTRVCVSLIWGEARWSSEFGCMDENARHGIMESCLRGAGMRLARPPLFRCAAAEQSCPWSARTSALIDAVVFFPHTIPERVGSLSHSRSPSLYWLVLNLLFLPSLNKLGSLDSIDWIWFIMSFAMRLTRGLSESGAYCFLFFPIPFI